MIGSTLRYVISLSPLLNISEKGDADTFVKSEDAWFTYENYMINNYPEGLPQLESAITGEDYLDEMSAPRIDPAQPGQNRKRRVTKIDKQQASDGEAEDD
jgi:hypothetical protein